MLVTTVLYCRHIVIIALLGLCYSSYVKAGHKPYDRLMELC